MVKSTSSCFKIITCSGADAVNDDGFEQIESKSSSMKRGWSFRKKSDRHRNTVILEDSSGGNREHLEAVTIDSHEYTSPPIFEKISPSKTVDTTAMASDGNSKVPDPLLLTENSRKIDPIISTESDDIGSLGIMKDASKVDPDMEESFAIVIQAAIRGYLSQKALLKIKNVVKLQAAVRGHLVRSQAVGTLRCVQAITKMQALVRTRHAQMLLEGSAVNMKDADGFGRNEKNTTPVGKEVKANPSFYCSEKILQNAFARQLLDSTPKKKPIHIKCDPLRPDSVWIWLERWMSASSPDQPQQPEFNQSNEEHERLVDAASCGVQTIAPSVSGTGGSKADLRQTTDSDGEDSSIEDADSFDIQFLKPNTSKDDEYQQPSFDGVGVAEDTNSKTQTNQTELSANLASESVINSIPNEPGEESEQPKHVSKMIPSEEPETEGKKIAIGSRKASNPAFVAAQSKFEELSSAISPSMSLGSTSKGIAIESRFDGLLSPSNSQTKTTEMTMSEDSGGLDLGTEVNRSSTLDSPGRSEVTSGEKGGESKVVEEVVSDLNGTTSLEHPDEENPVQVHPEKLEIVNAVDSVVDRDFQQSERSASDVQVQHELPMDQPGYKSSPEGSLRSHVTVPESYGTPSSQVSVKAKRKDTSTHTHSRKSKSADKRSPSNPNHDSGTRNSTEKLLKNGKRRNSFGSTKTDNADEEPRESNSSTLPSYMQATESARAKAQANNSPRSSPDVQDSELYHKKRHSLPNASGKQVSPRVLSSSPQAQLIAKGDQVPSSRGRWQR